MHSDTKLGLDLVVLLGVCCAGPLILSLLASGAVLGALSAVWGAARPLLVGGSTLLIAGGVWLLVRRSVRGGRALPCDAPERQPPGR